MAEKKKILFVCTGNTCRSPMAEGFLKAALEADDSLAVSFTAASAGLGAYAGDFANPKAIQALRDDWYIDISGHRASALLDEAVEAAFLILTMKEDQKQFILSSYPEAVKKVYTLKEYSYGTINNMGTDISDPFAGSLGVYKTCACEIKQAVDALVERLKKMEL